MESSIMLIFLSTLIFQVHSLPVETEPVCLSRFDYDVKLLERVLKMEMVLDSLKSKVETDLENFFKRLEVFKQEFDDMKATTDQKVSETISYVKANYSEIVSQATDTLTNVRRDANDQLADIREQSMKKTIVFHVKDVATQPLANEMIKFTTVVENVDNGYDRDTGRFTAKVAGAYWFSVQLCTSNNKEIYPSLFVNDALVNRIRIIDNDRNSCNSMSAIAVLQPGDTVSVKAGPAISKSPVWVTDDLNRFMGALIH